MYCVHKRNLVIEFNILIKAQAHNEEQRGLDHTRNIESQAFGSCKFRGLLSVHVGDVQRTEAKEVAESRLKHLNAKVGQCKADYESFLRPGVQHKHSFGQIFMHRSVYINSFAPIDISLPTGQDEAASCDSKLHGLYRSVLGAVAHKRNKTEDCIKAKAYRSLMT